MTTAYHHDTSSSNTPPWVPLDALADLWAAFGKEATTAAATSATSKAFAALAAERDALRHFNLARQEQRRSLVAPSSTWFRASSDHDYAIELLSKAAE